jgi:hypothetical protein
MAITKLAAVKAREEALAAVSSAAGPKALAKAVSALDAASLVLAQVEASIAAAKETRHVKTKEVHTTKESDDEDEPEEEEEGEEEESEPEEEEEEEETAAAASSDDDDEDNDEDDDEDDDEEERCKAQALASAKESLKAAKATKSAPAIKAATETLAALKSLSRSKASENHKALKAAARAVTGKKGTKALVGGLQTLGGTASATEALAAKIARLEGARRGDKVMSMLVKAKKEGKIASAQFATLKTQDPKWLKAHLAALPKMVTTTEDPARVGRTLDGGTDSTPPATTTTTTAKLTSQGLEPSLRKALEGQAAAAGKDFDAFLEGLNAQMAKNGVAS